MGNAFEFTHSVGKNQVLQILFFVHHSLFSFFLFLLVCCFLLFSLFLVVRSETSPRCFYDEERYTSKNTEPKQKYRDLGLRSTIQTRLGPYGRRI